MSRRDDADEPAWPAAAEAGQTEPAGGPEARDAAYAAAYRLLVQLRPLARQLSAGLEPVTIAEAMLDALRAATQFDRGAVFVRTSGTRLVPLAVAGADRVAWQVEVGADPTPDRAAGPHNVFGDVWLSQRPQRLGRQLSDEPGAALVMPLVAGLRTFGVVGLEWATGDGVDEAAAARATDEAAPRLDTALLFDEVRSVATIEERRRLAREIHDGIAQELTYLGYVVDSLLADSRRGDAAALIEPLGELRGEVTRLVRELRMSIFDLRSDVDTHGGLGAALTEHVQSVGRQAGLTVHLSLTEATHRLPADTEAELLRIAQEAVTNARKHAAAKNLWVSLEVDPPTALLRVEDDGRGLGDAREDSYGLSIMRERAARLRTTVTIGDRHPCGTTVEVRLPNGRRPAG